MQSTLPSPEDFIENNYRMWNFTPLIQAIIKTTTGKCCFRIKKEKNFIDILNSREEKEFYLSKNGTFKEMSEQSEDCLLIYSRKELVDLIEAMYEDIKGKCESEGLDSESVDFDFNISPKLEKVGPPSHLFTLEEIRDLMKEADDSELNQLVIDEEGFPHLNHTPGMGRLYPVSQESWYPHNYYVGPDSSLSDAEPSYHLCLEGWLIYLTTGRAFYSDLYPQIDNIDEVIRQIKDLSTDNQEKENS